MKIGILGSRGIPNHYGGFEQFVSHLAPALVERGARVWVYNSHLHPYRGSRWKGVNIIRCHDPEDRLGTAGQFVYDFNCIRDSRKRNFDILLQLGYTSSSVWFRLLPEGPVVVTNMDGLEWQRSKYSAPVRRFLKYAEKLAVWSSDVLIADSEAIRDYLSARYAANAEYIPYGAGIFNDPDPATVAAMGLKPKGYFLVIARLQPDNHVREIIEGVQGSSSGMPLVIVGDASHGFGRMLQKNYSGRVRFTGSIYDQKLLNNLRHFSALYFHGHSAGGTNPSLLEAMAARALICAHDNPFNRSVLNRNAFYFKSPDDIPGVIRRLTQINPAEYIDNNLRIIKAKYNWQLVIDAYQRLFTRMLT